MTATHWTVNSIKDAVRAKGSHWFDPDTMRSFGTRVGDTVYQGPGGIYFVTSEKPPHGPRSYSVRQFTPKTADIGTVGEFCELSKAQATRQAKQLAATPLQTQWLQAIQAVDEAVTGARHGKTFDPARNYLSLESAFDRQVIHFPGDGGYTRAVARQHDDESGFYLELIQTGATDRKEFWHGAYNLRREAERVLQTYATGAYEESATESAEQYKPVSILEQFTADLETHGNHGGPRSDLEVLAHDLIERARQHHRYMERLCSDEAFCRQCNEEGEHPRVTRCRQEIESLARRAGAKGVLFSGDPRGCTVKLTFADGYTDDLAKEGLCVPTEE